MSLDFSALSLLCDWQTDVVLCRHAFTSGDCFGLVSWLVGNISLVVQPFHFLLLCIKI